MPQHFIFYLRLYYRLLNGAQIIVLSNALGMKNHVILQLCYVCFIA